VLDECQVSINVAADQRGIGLRRMRSQIGDFLIPPTSSVAATDPTNPAKNDSECSCTFIDPLDLLIIGRASLLLGGSQVQLASLGWGRFG
jgi:hypothetical protein